MVVLTIREGSEIEIETPNGLIRLKLYKKNGKRRVRIDTGSNRWPITRTNLVPKRTTFQSPPK
jgi:hypothetical protein